MACQDKTSPDIACLVTSLPDISNNHTNKTIQWQDTCTDKNAILVGDIYTQIRYQRPICFICQKFKNCHLYRVHVYMCDRMIPISVCCQMCQFKTIRLKYKDLNLPLCPTCHNPTTMFSIIQNIPCDICHMRPQYIYRREILDLKTRTITDIHPVIHYKEHIVPIVEKYNIPYVNLQNWREKIHFTKWVLYADGCRWMVEFHYHDPLFMSRIQYFKDYYKDHVDDILNNIK